MLCSHLTVETYDHIYFLRPVIAFNLMCEEAPLDFLVFVFLYRFEEGFKMFRRSFKKTRYKGG